MVMWHAYEQLSDRQSCLQSPPTKEDNVDGGRPSAKKPKSCYFNYMPNSLIALFCWDRSSHYQPTILFLVVLCT